MANVARYRQLPSFRTHLQQKFHRSKLVVTNRITQRRVVVDVHGVDVYAFQLNESSHDVDLTTGGCEVQGGAIVVVAGRRVSVAGDQTLQL